MKCLGWPARAANLNIKNRGAHSLRHNPTGSHLPGPISASIFRPIAGNNWGTPLFIQLPPSLAPDACHQWYRWYNKRI